MIVSGTAAHATEPLWYSLEVLEELCERDEFVEDFVTVLVKDVPLSLFPVIELRSSENSTEVIVAE
jgi:uncharacterized protein (DUF2344 family)